MRTDAPRTPWLEMAALAVLVLAVRLVYIDRNPHYDELYHVLAAQSLIESGELSINEEGKYTRARLFTHIVAAFMRVGGDHLVAARMPALLASTTWALLVFWWLRRRAGAVAAWTAGMLMCFEPGMIFLGQFCRFYALHGLAIWIACMAAYAAIEKDTSGNRRVGGIVLALAALALAHHLQPSTLIAGMALGAAVAIVLLPAVWRALAARSVMLAVAAFVGVVIVAAAAAGFVLGSGTTQDSLSRFFWSPTWNEMERDNVRFYYDLLTLRLGFVWALFPVAVVLALHRDFPRALFSTAFLFVAFVVHSLAGAKDLRYLAYAIPFMFVVWGLALSVALPALHALLRTVLARILPGPRLEAALGALSTLGVCALLLYALYSIYSFNITQNMIMRSPAHGPYQASGWAAALDQLRELAESADAIVTSSGTKATYYLGDYDLEVNHAEYEPSLRRQRDGEDEEDRPVQVVDWRLGRPNARDHVALRQLMDERKTGLIVIEGVAWRTYWGVTPGVADFIEANAKEVIFPEDINLVVFRWGPPASE